MDAQLRQRAYRKVSKLEGWVHLGGKIRQVTVKNISISGALIHLEPESPDDQRQILKSLSLSKTIDFFLSSWGISGIAKIIWGGVTEQGQVSFAMEFQDLHHSADTPSFNRKNYRAAITIPGRLYLNGYYFDFMTVNMSADGMMVRLPLIFGVEEGMAVAFKFPHANLKGLARVVWAQDNENDETLIGLQIIQPDKQQVVAEKKPADLSNLDFVRIDKWLSGISLSSEKVVAEKKSVDLSGIKIEWRDESPGDFNPPPLFCGKNLTSQLQASQKTRRM